MIDAINFERDSNVETKARRSLTDLEKFVVKLVLVLIAALVFLYAVAAYVQSRIESVALFKGGPVFWAQAEKKLYSLADEPDLPDQKKVQIVKAPEKLSTKYRPYIDAIAAPERE